VPILLAEPTPIWRAIDLPPGTLRWRQQLTLLLTGFVHQMGQTGMTYSSREGGFDAETGLTLQRPVSASIYCPDPVAGTDRDLMAGLPAKYIAAVATPPARPSVRDSPQPACAVNMSAHERGPAPDHVQSAENCFVTPMVGPSLSPNSLGAQTAFC
jgi:hypothetical protein